MTEALVGAVIIIGLVATIFGTAVAIARVVNPWVYRWEQRHPERAEAGQPPATIHPLHFYRARRDRTRRRSA